MKVYQALLPLAAAMTIVGCGNRGTAQNVIGQAEGALNQAKEEASIKAPNELKAAETTEADRGTREAYITDAVEHLITALSADPYNVSATYHLAAAYARIGRRQCSLNLLQRLLQLRPHASRRAEVEQHLDRLLGRKQVLDPDFADMRRDERFRALIQNMCEGTNDASCVFGGQSGRSRDD